MEGYYRHDLDLKLKKDEMAGPRPLTRVILLRVDRIFSMLSSSLLFPFLLCVF